jgi:hypothetical protein
MRWEPVRRPAVDALPCQSHPQLAEPAIEARLDRRQGDVQGLRDLGEREALVLLEDHDLALLLGQRRHRGGHDAREVARFDQVERARARVAQRRLPSLFDVVEAQVRPPPAPAQAVARRVDRDLVEPGGEPRLLLERAQRTVGLEERLLAEVARFVVISHDPIDDALDLAVPAADELVEGGNVAGLEGHHQIFVGRRHGIPLVLDANGP